MIGSSAYEYGKIEVVLSLSHSRGNERGILDQSTLSVCRESDNLV